ncbi:unnamed protein product [Brugia pahangi]|uniref:CPG4 domain-containing protein n=1 Tax=Brugia pahangi TaxID=6280 RepID=A0A0N4TUF3_BRUPA|nr:unnamed protein product [Brugia pahangi]
MQDKPSDSQTSPSSLAPAAEAASVLTIAWDTKWPPNCDNILSQLVHDSNVQLAQFRNVVQCIGTGQDGLQLRSDVDSFGRTCIRACEAAKSCILPQLRHESVEFTRHASQFIGCVNACVVEMRRCAALERTFPNGEPCITQQQIEHMEEMLETLENLITVHYSTSESSPAERVTPRRRRATNCRPACVCSKLKTSYA